MKNISNFQLIFAIEKKKKSVTVSYVVGLILKNLSGPFSGPEPERFCTGKRSGFGKRKNKRENSK